MTALALALGASLAWGVGDFLGGTTSRRLPMLTVLAVSQVAGLAAVCALTLALRHPPFAASGFAWAGAAGLAGALGLAALYRGMAVGAIGVVAPVSSAAAVIPVAVGLVRGERPSPLQLAGIAVVLTGVTLAAREPGKVGGRIAAGVGLALVAAAGFGSYFVLIDEASERGVLWAVLIARASASAVSIAAAATRRALHSGGRLLPVLALVGGFDVGANALLALALTRGYVSLVAVLASLYPVVTILLARGVLGERLARTQAVGVTTALAGVAIISAG